MTEKESYLQSWDREFQTTMKVLKAYPADKLELKPNERARSMRELAWTFVGEERLIDHALQGEIKFEPPPPPPKTLQEILRAYEVSHNEMREKVNNITEAEYNRTIKFPTGPKQMGDFRKADIFWMMMYDMIHHRGQLSVYLRMAGGKVPSIYGPSGDEPWA